MSDAGSTLPPKRDGAKPRPKRKVEDDIPKGKLPSKKRRKSAAPAAKDWGPAKEAAAARSSVLAKSGRKATVPIDPLIEKAKPAKRTKVVEELAPGPMGGKLKRSRKVTVPDASRVCEADPEPEKVEYRPRAADLLAKLRGSKRPAMCDEAFHDICLLIAEGIPLREICRFEDMPTKTAFYEYLEARGETDEGVRAARHARYDRARELGFDELSEETLEIVDDGTNDWIERQREDGSTYYDVDRENIARSKLRAEHRLKLLAVWAPRRYGTLIKVGDPDGNKLDRPAQSVNDLAIWIGKVMAKAQHDPAAIADGVTIEGEVSGS